MKTTLWRLAIVASTTAYAALKMFGVAQPREVLGTFFTELFAYALAVVVIYGLASLAFERLWIWLAAGTVGAFAAGYVMAGPEHLLEIVLTVGAVTITGTLIGVLIERDHQPFRVYVAAIVLATAFILGTLLPHWAERQTAAQGWRDLLVKDFADAATTSGYSAEMQQSSRDAFQHAMDTVIRLIPASTVLSGIVQVSGGFLWFGARLRRNYNRTIADPFALWKVPFGVFPAVILMVLMRLFGGEVLTLIADNGLMVMAIFYCLSGLSVVDFMVRRLNLGWFMKALFYVMLFLTQIFGFLLVSLLGIIDSFADWRKIGAAKIALKS